ncbi:Molybdenum ABC transporter, periplasmic molybdenum-binding protein ModA [Fulvivirga imtechensis AK7]|uniref:Molybdenum ABC transporter, periplasmic molybdenum-binding protein ModA n=1 Tax=Fulvivirga imtechensis AK7 TaxID=1237149 RepID=L8JWK8_9BACT|nr:molybdate ABC transporter substrate-binding protein [Fulvivirga imtechensis]ELR73436.1 Molybdenum ABC transporter, periplasmic molybdenum-binding protein ModA [Fulvivirga imtechensis AK7]
MNKILLLLFTIMVVCACRSGNDAKLTIATSANMRFAIKELVDAFSEQTGIDCEIITGSSGKLMAQIIEGAPYDLFVSADMKYPEALYQRGFTTGTPQTYAYGRLVLWSAAEGIEPDITILTSGQINHIALANPKTAPYGQAAVEVLKHYDIYEKVEQKLVYGESISQTNQFIISGAAEVGFTAKSVVLSSEMADRGAWIAVDENACRPIAQGAVIVKSTGEMKKAEKFYAFLFSEQAKEILEHSGYAKNEYTNR